jgi:UDP-N-acetyl-D-mannosaminuronic acid dehydrogenase
MKPPFSKVSVIGLGYIGLPTAAVLASRGLEVIGVDIDQVAVETINKGKIHIVEPDLEAIVHAVVTTGRLRATTIAEKAEAYLVAVPTPFTEGHVPDISYVKAAAQSIAPVLQKGCLVVLESTSPVGTTELMSRWLAESRKDLTFPHQAGENADVQVAYCPERVLPGHILNELVQNDRVIGGVTRRCAERARSLYQLFVAGRCLLTDCRTAEMCKLTENAFRDVNIAFANELSLICDELGLNVWELIKLANYHPRVNILQPGPGVGGHCIAVDPWFIVHSAPNITKLIRAAREVNDGKPQAVVRKIKYAASQHLEPIIACLGLAFKADIDDLRESPAVEIVRTLAQSKVGKLLIVEPHIDELPATLRIYQNVALVSLEEALLNAQVVVLLVNHRMFSSIPGESLTGKSVIDTRGLFENRLDSAV